MKQPLLEKDKVLGIFDRKGNFLDFHKRKHELGPIKNIIIE